MECHRILLHKGDALSRMHEKADCEAVKLQNNAKTACARVQNLQKSRNSVVQETGP